MRYRRFQIASGQFVQALFTTEGEQFSTPAEAQAADLSRAFGAALTAVEADADPWDGVSALLAAPVRVRPPRVLTPLERALAALAADPALATATKAALTNALNE